MREFDANQVPHLCVGKGQQGIKPLPPLSFRLNFSSLRLGEMLAQYLNGIVPLLLGRAVNGTASLFLIRINGGRNLKYNAYIHLLSSCTWRISVLDRKIPTGF